MKIFKRLLFIILATGAISASVTADIFEHGDRGDRLVLVWVTIKAKPNEGLWQACRRVYQRDVYQVRRGSGFTVRCKIHHSRIYDYGERLQNFNRRDR